MALDPFTKGCIENSVCVNYEINALQRRIADKIVQAKHGSQLGPPYVGRKQSTTILLPQLTSIDYSKM